MGTSYELRHKEYPAKNPGSWKDSTLIFKAKGPRGEIARVIEAVKQAMAGLYTSNGDIKEGG